MIYESSVDYERDIIIALFDGETPTENDVNRYVADRFGVIAQTVSIHPPTEAKGLENPGTITVTFVGLQKPRGDDADETRKQKQETGA